MTDRELTYDEKIAMGMAMRVEEIATLYDDVDGARKLLKGRLSRKVESKEGIKYYLYLVIGDNGLEFEYLDFLRNQFEMRARRAISGSSSPSYILEHLLKNEDSHEILQRNSIKMLPGLDDIERRVR